MSKIATAIRFITIAIIVSIQTSIFGVLYEGKADASSLINSAQLILIISVLYFLIVLISGLLVGVPAIVAFRKIGKPNSQIGLGLLGLIFGMLTCILIFMAFGVSAGDALGIGALLGGSAGFTSGILWWLFVERFELKENYDQ